MSQILVMATLKLNDEKLLEDWKTLSKKITEDLTGQDGFIWRESGRDENGLIYCILRWESKEKQEKFMSALMARTDDEHTVIMTEFSRVVNMQSMTKEIVEVF